MYQRVTDERLTRLARKAWPYATVTVALIPEGAGHRSDYQLERPGIEVVALGTLYDNAKLKLQPMVKARLNTVALRWQDLTPLVLAELELRGCAPAYFEESFAARKLKARIPAEGSGPDYFVEMVHDDDLIDGDLQAIARRFAMKWNEHMTLAKESNV
jgi:hypothetical protein